MHQYQQARVSKSMTKPEPRTNCLWIFSWLSEQTSVRITYFLQIPGCTFNILEQGYIPTSHHNVHMCSQTYKYIKSFNPALAQTPNGCAAMRSKTNIETSWNSSENTHRCMFSRRKKTNKNNLEVACWDRPNLIPHAVPLFISILQRFDSTYLKMNETISIFRCQRIWFHAQMIHLFHSTIVYSAPTGSSSDFSLRQILSQCSWQGSPTLLCNQHGRNVTCSPRVASCQYEGF